MIGEAIAFHFAMVYFYPELVCLPNGFEVIADCRNLTYWKTSDSPVLAIASLRASLSGRFDLSKVKLRHINRVHNFTADSLARLSITEPNPSFLEIMCSVYEFPLLAEIILDDGPTYACSMTEIPDSFPPSDFSPAELLHLKTDKTSHVVGSQPVTRQLHGHPVFVMPISKVKSTFVSAHVTDEGPHLSAESTRANLAHLHWSGKAGSGANSFRALMCTVCQQNAAIPCYKIRGHAGARPTAFGELVFFDHKTFVQIGGSKLVLGTSLDKATGLFRACHIPDEKEESAIVMLKDWQRTAHH
jgi:hypothetical protein